MNSASVFPTVPTLTLSVATPQIQSCDILLMCGNSFINNLIKTGTGSVWSHVAMVLQLSDGDINRLMVMESLETVGVRSVPLINYISNYNGTGVGFSGEIMVARYINFPTIQVSAAASKAIDLLGYPYSMEDIMKIAARIGLNDAIDTVTNSLIGSNKAYICSEYVEACFKAAGINVPYNKEGYISPADFAKCPQITPLFFISGV